MRPISIIITDERVNIDYRVVVKLDYKRKVGQTKEERFFICTVYRKRKFMWNRKVYTEIVEFDHVDSVHYWITNVVKQYSNRKYNNRILDSSEREELRKKLDSFPSSITILEDRI
jgi:hypothetical protein